MGRDAWLASVLPCSEEFGWWFAGLVDGEGCFHIGTRWYGYICNFTIKLREDDRPLLESVKDELGIGTVSTGEHASKNGKPWVAWKVAKKAELLRLTEVLDAFPLRSKKARDYTIWREAAIYWGTSSQPIEWAPVREAHLALKETRAYVPSSEAHGNRLGFPSAPRRHGS